MSCLILTTSAVNTWTWLYFPTMLASHLLNLPYGMKILHGIKFYGFMVGDTTVKLKSINFLFYVLIAQCLCDVASGLR